MIDIDKSIEEAARYFNVSVASDKTLDNDRELDMKVSQLWYMLNNKQIDEKLMRKMLDIYDEHDAQLVIRTVIACWRRRNDNIKHAKF